MSFAAPLLAVVLGMLASGCSDPEFRRVAVKGRVNLDGEPLDWGTITFIPERGIKGPKTAAEISAGVFELDKKNGPPLGRLKVWINNRGAPAFPGPGGEQFARPDPEVLIPPRYNDETILVVETTPEGPNQFTFELTSGPVEIPEVE